MSLFPVLEIVVVGGAIAASWWIIWRWKGEPAAVERCLRRLAALAAVLMAVWPVAFALKAPSQFVGKGWAAVVFHGSFFILGVLAVLRFARRAAGRSYPKGPRDRDLWWGMMVWNLIFWLPLDWGKGTTVQRVLHLVFSVSVLLGLTGGRLEQRSGK